MRLGRLLVSHLRVSFLYCAIIDTEFRFVCIFKLSPAASATNNINFRRSPPQIQLDAYDYHAKNGDIEDEEEEDDMGQDSDYEQEGQPDCESDEEEDTREIAGVLKDSNGRSHVLKKRERKY